MVCPKEYVTLYNKLVDENFFQSPEAYEILEKSPDYKPLLVQMKDKAFLAWQSTRKIGDINMGHASIRGEPITQSLEDLERLLETAKNVSKPNPIYIRIYPLEETKILKCIDENCPIIRESWLDILIDINCDDIYEKMNRKRRWAIRTGEKNLEFEMEYEFNAERTWKLLELVRKRKKIDMQSQQFFETVSEVLGPQKKVAALYATKGNTTVAVFVFLLFGKFIYAWYAGSNSQYMKFHPNEFLVWKGIQLGQEHSKKIFHFGGGGQPDLDLGYRGFKKGYGGRIEDFGRYTYIIKPLRAKALDYASRHIQRA